jgi:predicted PurR-regulated permease PerM
MDNGGLILGFGGLLIGVPLFAALLDWLGVITL